MRHAERVAAHRRLKAAGWECRLKFTHGGPRIYLPPDKVGWLYLKDALTVLDKFPPAEGPLKAKPEAEQSHPQPPQPITHKGITP